MANEVVRSRQAVADSPTGADASPSSEWMDQDEARVSLHRETNSDAKKLLRHYGIPIVPHSERDWLVRRSRVEGLLDKLEREDAARLQNADSQRDWCEPTKRRPRKPARSRATSKR